MKQLFSILFLLLILGPASKAQSPSNTHFQKIDEQRIVLFYTQNYYLVEQACAFKSIQRNADFDFTSNTFIGVFEDRNIQGNVVLRGRYKNGLKDGYFEAFHPNGQKKWEVVFVADQASGIWRYYYPDGQPFLELDYSTDTRRILRFWDQKQKLRVSEGRGNYEMIIPLEGYSEYGFSLYERKGAVLNGLPNGLWTIRPLSESGKRSNYPPFQENYHHGVLVEYISDYYEITNYNDFAQLVPPEYFDRAPALLIQNCTFDEYANFSQYLTSRIGEYFGSFNHMLMKTDHFTLTLTVDKEGKPSNLVYQKKLQNQTAQTRLESALISIPYYFPSLQENNPIADTLTINGIIQVDNYQNLHFPLVEISRKATE